MGGYSGIRRLAKLLFEQHQISFPVTKLTALSDIIGSEHSGDIEVESRFSASSGATWSVVDTVGR